MKRIRKSSHLVYGIVLFCILIGVGIGAFLHLFGLPRLYSQFPTLLYPELRALSGNTMSFGQLSTYFITLSRSKGAVYAFDVLKQADIPKNIDMHLLGHLVGDELYKQKGVEGIGHCTQDFRNACSHSIVVGYFLKHGEEGLPTIAQTCRSAPGGKGAYTMCFHGLGHGILAAVGYELKQAVALCQKTGTPEYGFRESSECVGGIIMEIISGGSHDKPAWEKAHTAYLSQSDPLYPCNDDTIIPPDVKGSCYEYLTPHLITMAGGTLERIPPDDTLRRAFSYCTAIADSQLRSICYQGFGKEFVVLVKDRDIRSSRSMTKAQMQSNYHLCSLADSIDGEKDCILHSVDSLYWGGENDPSTAISFCTIAQRDQLQSACFAHLVGIMHFFNGDSAYHKAFCSRIPESYRTTCESYE